MDQGWPAGIVKKPPFIDPTISNNQSASTSEIRPGGSGRLPCTQQWQMGPQQTFHGILVEPTYVVTVAHGITNNALVNINQLPTSDLAFGIAAHAQHHGPAGSRGGLPSALCRFPWNAGAGAAALSAVPGHHHHGRDLVKPQDQYNRRAEKSLANDDARQRFTLSYSYELPLGKGKAWLKSGVPAAILGGWSVAAIHTYNSGGPLQITIPNNLPIFGGSLRPFRRIKIREQWRFELRGDFFNLLNRRNLNNPITDLTNANFGRITGQGPARSVQLGFRMEF